MKALLIIELIILAIVVIGGFLSLTWMQTVPVTAPDKSGLSRQELQASTREAMVYDKKRRRRVQQ